MSVSDLQHIMGGLIQSPPVSAERLLLNAQGVLLAPPAHKTQSDRERSHRMDGIWGTAPLEIAMPNLKRPDNIAQAFLTA